MEITINGVQACLKKNTSFEFISENSLFTGSDSYTLNICFPLKDCPTNLAIFGHINRTEVEKTKVIFDCVIRDKEFIKVGTITITEINDVEVKTQFLEGRSEQNFYDNFDEICINQLSLGFPTDRAVSSMGPSSRWNSYGVSDWVALPWVNNYSGNMQNGVSWNSEDFCFDWNTSESELSFQPYLLYILKKICEAVGYSYDFSALENSDYKNLLICNTLPAAWGYHNFAIALPHWTLTEFFEQLEYFLYGEFVISHKDKKITFKFSTQVVKNTQMVYIDKVINKYTAEVSLEDSAEYLGLKNLMYADNDNRYWGFRSCDWYIRDHKSEAVVYDRLSDLITFARTLQISGYERIENGSRVHEVYSRGYRKSSDGHNLFYAKDVDRYFIMWCYKSEFLKTQESTYGTTNYYKYYNRLEPINQFGDRYVSDDVDDVELNIVPAWLDDTENGQCLFLDCGEMGSALVLTEDTDEDGNTTSTQTGSGRSQNGTTVVNGSTGGTAAYGERGGYTDPDVDYNSGALAQSKQGILISKGEQNKSDAYFDKLYMAFWNYGAIRNGHLTCPIVDSLRMDNDFNVVYASYSLKLDVNNDYINRKEMYRIDGKKKYNFSFLSDSIPDPKAVFNINGHLYLCEKITATFHEAGRSQLLKGVFYEIIG